MMSITKTVLVAACLLPSILAFCSVAPAAWTKASHPRYFSNRRIVSSSAKSTGKSCTVCYAASKAIHKDVVIIGGGLAGLSAALNLATDPKGVGSRQVTIVDSMSVEDAYSAQNTAGSFAAAGMLAPQSERLPPGPLLDLCLKSRAMYPDFVSSVEDLARDSGLEGEDLLWKNKEDDSTHETLKPWEVGFHATGGFLAPAFAGDSVATWAPPAGSGNARWLDEIQVHELEPQLHSSVVGGWWFPEDASVDARRLTCSLRAACVAAGVHMQLGKEYGVSSLELQDGHCSGVRLNNGKIYSANSIVVANGAWMRNLIPVPITPHKGQSLSLRMPSNQPPILNRVLFAQDTYIVPKADGRIVVGATVEPGSFDPSVTPAGMLHCIENACRLMPGLKDLPIEESWTGLRPTTPDKAPILGRTSWDNLFIAGGYWRNGVLLAPKTGQLIGDLVQNNLDEGDSELLDAFTWERFVSPGGGSKLAMDSRYASSFYPTQQRAKGFGVSAAVGTELGFYSDASAAKEERAQDRAAMFGSSDESLEKAAKMGTDDGVHFTFDDEEKKVDAGEKKNVNQASLNVPDLSRNATKPPEASDSDVPKNDLSAMYDAIIANKQEQNVAEKEMGIAVEEDRPDPGFRIHHVDSVTGETVEVPPYTRPEEFVASLQQSEPKNVKNQSTFDGYTAIEEAYGDASWEAQREKMKKSRLSNRFSSEVDASVIGAASWDTDTNDDSLAVTEDGGDPQPVPEKSDMSAIYKKIKKNKESKLADVKMGEAGLVDKPDPGFRIYRVDQKTRETAEVPPFTRPEEFEALLALKDTPDPAKLESMQPSIPQEKISSAPDERTYDGYVAIEEAYGSSRKEQLLAMKAARIANRAEEYDQTGIGAKPYGE